MLFRSRIYEVRGGAEDRFEKESRAFFGRVTQGFTEIARREPKRCVTIEAAGSMDEVEARVWQAVEPRLEKWKKAQARATKACA